MKKFNLTCYVQAIYNTSIMVPDNLDYDGALKYAKEHFDEVPRGPIVDLVDYSDEIDEENCDFED